MMNLHRFFPKSLYAIPLLVLAIELILPRSSRAEGINIRPIQDFLEAQGSTSQLVPPVPDYVGWLGSDSINFAFVDYAGLANEFIEDESDGAISLNTRTLGSVAERRRRNGSAAVRVRLRTEEALAWGFLFADADFDNDPFPFLNTPLSFGARAQDVLEGADPSLGISSLRLRFTNSAPNAPLPDLLQLINEPLHEQLPLRLSFVARVTETRADGILAILTIKQVCEGKWKAQEARVGVVCWRDIVDIQGTDYTEADDSFGAEVAFFTVDEAFYTDDVADVGAGTGNLSYFSRLSPSSSSKSTPEPTSVMGLLGLGTLATSSLIKRKQQ